MLIYFMLYDLETKTISYSYFYFYRKRVILYRQNCRKYASELFCTRCVLYLFFIV